MVILPESQNFTSGVTGTIPIEQTPDDIEATGVPLKNPTDMSQKLNGEKDLPDPLATPELPTPVILPKASDQPPPEPPPIPMKPTGGAHWRKLLINLLIFAVLFGLGIGASLLVQRFFNNTNNVNPGQAYIETTPIPTPDNQNNLTRIYRILKDKNDTATQYVVNLPTEVLIPVCDDSICQSRGSYLPGGTRLTVVFKSDPKPAPNFDQTVITDVTGKKFETTTATVAGMLAREYQGVFIGTTSGGYRFTQMHGFMIKVPTGNLLEINHFAPAGITTDFAGDEAVFSKIITSLKSEIQDGSAPQFTPTVTPLSANQSVCGGIDGATCSAGYRCQTASNTSDATGLCVRE